MVRPPKNTLRTFLTFIVRLGTILVVHREHPRTAGTHRRKCRNPSRLRHRETTSSVARIHCGHSQVFVVGHDLGAIMAWGLASFRPEMVKGLVTLSVPYMPRHPTLKPIAAFNALYGKNHYIVRFQDAGVIEAEFDRIGYKNALRILLTVPPPNPPILLEENPFGSEFSNKEHSTLPAWLTQQDLDYYTEKFTKTGFTGPLNHYRCLDKNWELMAPWQGSKVNVPVKFIIGDEDLVYTMLGNKEYIHNAEFKKKVPMLQDVIIMEGAGHFIQQERPQEVTNHIYQFIKTV